MSEPTPAHVLIVDTDPELREALKSYLKKHHFLVSLARDAAHARRLLSGLEFDLVLIEGRLDGADALAGEIGGPVLILCRPGSAAFGTAERIEKPFEPRELLTRINAILDRRPVPVAVTPRVLQLGAHSFDVERGMMTRGTDPVRLTATEVGLLRILAARPGVPVERGELASLLGRNGLATRARAIDVQITRLRRKLEADTRMPRYLQTVRGAGYMLVPD